MIKLLALLLAFFCCLPVSAQFSSGSATLPLGAPVNPGDLGDSLASHIILGPYIGNRLQNYRTLVIQSPLVGTDGGAKMPYTIGTNAALQYFGGLTVTNQQTGVNQILNFPGLTSGDTIYFNDTNWVRLPKGTDGQLLTLASGLPSWSTAGVAAPAAAQYILATADAGLANGQVLTAGSGITSTPVAGTSNTIAVDSTVIRTTGAQSMAGPKTLSGGPIVSGSNTTGLVMTNGSFNATITSNPAANRTLDIPDPGANASFVMTAGAQTLAGVKTLSSAPVLSTGTLTSGANLMTFPSSAQTLVGRTSTDTLTNKTLTAPSFTAASTLTFLNAGGNYVVSYANPAATRAYNIYDANGPADFAMKSGTTTAGGAVYGTGNLMQTTAAGTSGQSLISAGASAPAWGIPNATNGGTNQTSWNTGDLLYASGANTLAKLPIGSSTNVLTVTGGVPTWAAGGTGTVTNFSAGDLSPLFTTTEATTTTTPALSFALTNAAAGTALRGPSQNASGAAASAGAPTYRVADPQDLPIFRNDCRVTLSTGVPVTSADVVTTNAVGVYVTPYLGNQITIYNTTQSRWITQTFAEAYVAVPATTNTMYDVFVTSASNTTITASLTAWTNDTTRATALTRLNGRYVSSANNALLYVGSMRTTGTSGQSEDSAARRLVWNYFNRVARNLKAADTTVSWAYTSATVRSANSNTTPGTGRTDFIVGVAECVVGATYTNTCQNLSSADVGGTGIAFDSTTVADQTSSVFAGGGNSYQTPVVTTQKIPAVGYHYIQNLEYGTPSTCNYYSAAGQCVQNGVIYP